MNKVALITGGSRGIGAAASKELARLGFTVAINYISHEKDAKDVLDDILALGGYGKCFQADISDPGDVERLFCEVERQLGSVDVLINNAGIAHIGLLQDMTNEEIKHMTDVNLLGPIYCSKRAIPSMIHKKSGVIINVASMWGEVGASCESVYSACKAGVIGLTKALAKELGPSGIRVNCVSPGVIRTQMNSELSEEDMRQLCDETPLLRIGTPEDVGRTIAFLSGENASFITGQIVSVNGGII